MAMPTMVLTVQRVDPAVIAQCYFSILENNLDPRM